MGMLSFAGPSGRTEAKVHNTRSQPQLTWWELYHVTGRGNLSDVKYFQ